MTGMSQRARKPRRGRRGRVRRVKAKGKKVSVSKREMDLGFLFYVAVQNYGVTTICSLSYPVYPQSLIVNRFYLTCHCVILYQLHCAVYIFLWVCHSYTELILMLIVLFFRWQEKKTLDSKRFLYMILLLHM